MPTDIPPPDEADLSRDLAELYGDLDLYADKGVLPAKIALSVVRRCLAAERDKVESHRERERMVENFRRVSADLDVAIERVKKLVAALDGR